MGVVTTDDHKAPVLAFWHRGLGRVASLTAEVDGQYSGRLNAWKGFQGFAVGLGRWLLGGEPPSSVAASLDRQGGHGIVRVELDPGRTRGGADDVRTATAAIVSPVRSGGCGIRPVDARVGGRRHARSALSASEGRPVPRRGAAGERRSAALAPLTSAVLARVRAAPDPKEGQKTLSEIARITGGIERTTWDGAFDASRLRNRQVRDLVWPLVLMLLVLHVMEIAGRRLLWFDAAAAWLRPLRLPRWRRAVAARPYQRQRGRASACCSSCVCYRCAC